MHGQWLVRVPAGLHAALQDEAIEIEVIEDRDFEPRYQQHSLEEEGEGRDSSSSSSLSSSSSSSSSTSGKNRKEKSRRENAELLFAASQGRIPEIHKALRDGAAINTKEFKIGYTALMYGAKKGNMEVMQLLLKKGADIEARSRDGQKSVLMVAAFYGQLEAVQFLLDEGANVNGRNARGDTALQIAAYTGRADVLEGAAECWSQDRRSEEQVRLLRASFCSLSRTFGMREDSCGEQC